MRVVLVRCTCNFQTVIVHYVGKFQLGKQFFRFQHNRIMLKSLFTNF